MSNKHGGKRQNSGAKPKYGEPTKSVTFRIPESKIPSVKKMVYDYLKVQTSSHFLKVAIDELLTYKTPKEIIDYMESENNKK